MAQAPNGDFYVSNTKDGQSYISMRMADSYVDSDQGKGPYEILAPKTFS